MFKLRPLTLAMMFVLTAGVSSSTAQENKRSTLATERSVRAFYDSYAEDLRLHRRDAIADRYDRRGIFHMGNGSKSFDSFEKIKDIYTTTWIGPKSFEWKDLSVDVLAKEVVAVLGRFEWTTPQGQVLRFSYTGIRVIHDGKWRIRIEDESIEPPKSAAN